MLSKENLALSLARREKRLRYWRAAFNKGGLNDKEVREINEVLNTYALLLAKLAKDTDPKEFETTECRLQTIERGLNSSFEKARLFTSDLYQF